MGTAFAETKEMPRTYHVVVLEHGITGNHKEMGYVKEAIERRFDGCSERKNSKLIVYSAKCNDKNSLDGIELGGKRLATEINDLLRETATEIAQEYQHKGCSDFDSNDIIGNTKIAFSIMGNSMGGLYGRFALKYIDWIVPVDLGYTAFEINVVPHIFATIATPHLGMKGMSYFTVPEFLEPLAAVIFGKSGSDLFRVSALKKEKSGRYSKKKTQEVKQNNEEEKQCEYNSIIERLSLDPEFLDPLSRFSRRIAYANAFSTDIAVPTVTAAFLFDDDCESDSENSGEISDASNQQDGSSLRSSESRHSSHIFVPGINDIQKKTADNLNYQDGQNATEYAFVRFDTAATTRRQIIHLNSATKTPLSTSDMARNLDSLGWSKVFIDPRPHIPSIWKRQNGKRNKSRRASFEDFIGSEPIDQEEEKNDSKLCYSSGALKRQLSGNGFDGKTLPFGHSFLIASTRGPVHKLLYKRARPFVDCVIAQEIVNEILRFVHPDEGDGCIEQ